MRAMVILLAVFFVTTDTDGAAATMADLATAEEGTKPRKGSVISSHFTTLERTSGDAERTRTDPKREQETMANASAKQ